MDGDGFDDAAIWSRYPSLEKVYYTTHAYLGEDSPAPAVAAFRRAYQAAYPGEQISDFAALGYDTVNLIAAAIRQAGSGDPGKVLMALENILDFEGVTRNMTYPKGQRIPVKTVSIIHITKGEKSLADTSARLGSRTVSWRQLFRTANNVKQCNSRQPSGVGFTRTPAGLCARETTLISRGLVVLRIQ